MSIKVTIKNSGKTYPLQLSLTDDTVSSLKLKIQNETSIPVERQKILVKSPSINDGSSSIESLGLKPDQVILVLGSPELNLPKKIENPIFLEDLDANGTKAYSNDLIGLENLGNSCYLNSSIQALYSIPILQKELLSNEKVGEIGTDAHLALQLKRVFKELTDKKEDSVVPEGLITSLRYLYPQFNERDEYGRFKQQDAEEVFTQLLKSLEKVLGDDFIENFTVRFKATIKNTENEEEVDEKYDNDLKLQCHISGQTNFLKNGIIDSLNETFEKHSESLNKSCTFESSKKIVKLPTVLTVQFVRFFWKRSTNKKSKILRKVQFPFQLDLADLLDDDYKVSKVKARDDLRSVEKQQLNEEREFKKSKKISYNEEDEFEKKAYEKYLKEYQAAFPTNLAPGENPSSLYNLNAIITHQGSSADSGHYQAFVKDKYNDSKWWRFNDDKVSIVDKDRIESLAGGGESDSALILIYKGFGLD